jgi:hypothetical protein
MLRLEAIHTDMTRISTCLTLPMQQLPRSNVAHKVEVSSVYFIPGGAPDLPKFPCTHPLYAITCEHLYLLMFY